MGTITNWKRNTSCDPARKEQEEDGCNGIRFSSKAIAKRRETGRSKEGGRQFAFYTHICYGGMLLMKTDLLSRFTNSVRAIRGPGMKVTRRKIFFQYFKAFK